MYKLHEHIAALQSPVSTVRFTPSPSDTALLATQSKHK